MDLVSCAVAYRLADGNEVLIDQHMIEAELTYNRRDGQSFVARVCDCSWKLHKNRNNWYAFAAIRVDGIVLHTCAMHRLLTQCPSQLQADHRDGDTLRNVLTNLRVCTITQNSQNAAKYRKSLSRFKGVKKTPAYPLKSNRPWTAQIHDRRPDGSYGCRSLGSFLLEEDAARAYDRAALEKFGEFSRLNFPLATHPQPVGEPVADNHTLSSAATTLWGKLRNGDQLNSAKATALILEVLEAIDAGREAQIKAAKADRAIYRRVATDLCRRLKVVAYRNPSDREMKEGNDLSKRCIDCGGKANKHVVECKIQKCWRKRQAWGLGARKKAR